MGSFLKDWSAPTATIDFNMVDQDGRIPALRTNIRGFAPGSLRPGDPITLRDADDNYAQGVVDDVQERIVIVELVRENAFASLALSFDPEVAAVFDPEGPAILATGDTTPPTGHLSKKADWITQS